MVVGLQADADLLIGGQGRHTLLRDLRDDAGTHRPPPLPDRKPQLLLHRHRRDQVDRHRHVVPRHHHLPPRPPPHHPQPPPPPHLAFRPLPSQPRPLPPPPPRAPPPLLPPLPHAPRRLRVLRLPHRPRRRPPDHRNLVPRKLVLLQQLPHRQLHQGQNRRVVPHVHLVHERPQKRHVHLPRQQHVLPR